MQPLWTGPAVATLALVLTAISCLITERVRQLLAQDSAPEQQDPPPADGAWPPVVVVIPLSGPDGNDGLMLARPSRPAFELPHYPGPLRVVLLAMTDDEAAVARAHHHVAALRAAGHDATARLTEPWGLNRKAAQLAQWSEGHVPLSAQELVLCLDSDVVPSTVALTGLVARLDAPPLAGAVWQAVGPWVRTADDGLAQATLGDRVALAVRAGSGHAFGVLAALDGSSLVGKAVLYRPAAVAAVGGWRPSVPYLGDDVALSQRLAQAGHPVRALVQPCAHEARLGQTLGAVLQRYRRWNAIMFAQRPHMLWTYPLFLFPLTVQLLMWATSAALGWSLGFAAAGALMSIIGRLALSGLARRSAHMRPTLGACLLDTLLAEAALCACFVAAACSRRVQWQGRPLAAARARRPESP